jgi:cytochrome c peroxidase
VLCLGGSAAWAEAVHQHPAPTVLAPGYFDLTFTAPAPGSYVLPPIRTAADGAVIDETGQPRRLYDYLGDKVVLLSFIFTTCSDVNGCPLASYVLKRVQDRLLNDPGLREQIRLVSVSFDARHDTPSVMAAYGERLRVDGFDWVFLAPRSAASLVPLLAAYDQWAQREVDENGNELGSFAHILRVLLIDRERRVRNIYSVSYLHADTVLNDARTVLMDESVAGSVSNNAAGAASDRDLPAN